LDWRKKPDTLDWGNRRCFGKGAKTSGSVPLLKKKGFGGVITPPRQRRTALLVWSPLGKKESIGPEGNFFWWENRKPKSFFGGADKCRTKKREKKPTTAFQNPGPNSNGHDRPEENGSLCERRPLWGNVTVERQKQTDQFKKKEVG